MRFASLGSGSEGNGLVVESGGTCVLIDCGFGVKNTAARLARLGVDEFHGPTTAGVSRTASSVVRDDACLEVAGTSGIERTISATRDVDEIAVSWHHAPR